MEQSPFLLTRESSTDFQIKLTIEFQDWTGQEQKALVHDLAFRGKGRTQNFPIEVDSEFKSKGLAMYI